MQEDWKQLLRERMDKAERPAPEGLLSSVKAEMARRGVEMPQQGKAEMAQREDAGAASSEVVQTKRRVVMLWTRRLAVAAAVAAVCGIAVYHYSPSTPSQPLAEHAGSSPSQPLAEHAGTSLSSKSTSSKVNLQKGKEQQTLVASADRSAHLLATATTTRGYQQQASSVNASVATASMMDADVAPMPMAKKELPDSVQEMRQSENNLMAAATPQSSMSQSSMSQSSNLQPSTPQSSVPQSNSRRDSYVEENDPFYARLSAAARETEDQPLLVDARVGGAVVSSLSSSSAPMYAASPANGVAYDDVVSGGEMSTEKLQDVLMANSVVSKEAHHEQPLRIGLSVAIPLATHWSLTTGVTGTRLTSDFTATSINERQNAHQRLYYLGVPVRMNYTLWQSRMWHVYVSGGGAVEQLVKGTTTTTITDLKGHEKSSDEGSVHEHRPQFSVGAAAGISFSFLKNFSFYVEPGVNYYIHNGSSVDNIYKDQPTQFQLDLGIRYRIK
ncbi:MAG: outer membrane beta-barrel protein [Prevotellaceae bacterium]|nr:outer membrane beta-barrel protein [Prevotellaceae bacterium]